MTRGVNERRQETEASLNARVQAMLASFAEHPKFVMANLRSADPYLRLRFEMKRRGISNKSLADQIGIHQTGIARGITHRTGLEKHWAKIAEVLNVELDWLEHGIDEDAKRIAELGPTSTKEIVLEASAGLRPQELISPVLAELAKTGVKLFKAPRQTILRVEGILEVAADCVPFGLAKGQSLLLRHGIPNPNGFIYVRMNDDVGHFGRYIEQKDKKEQGAEILLVDASGHIITIMMSQVAETFVVIGTMSKLADVISAGSPDRPFYVADVKK